MKPWTGSTLLLISYCMFVLSFYTASQKGINSTTDVAAKGGSFAVLNLRYLASLLAMTAAILYFDFLYSSALFPYTTFPVKALTPTLFAAAAAGIIPITGSPKIYLLLRNLPYNVRILYTPKIITKTAPL